MDMTWKTTRRESGLIEHICEHLVGHPNAGSIERMDDLGGKGNSGSWGVHGCDGCCHSNDFPGSAENTLMYTIGFYKEHHSVALDEIMSLIEKYPFFYYALRAVVNGR